jgi:hypothetical protein
MENSELADINFTQGQSKDDPVTGNNLITELIETLIKHSPLEFEKEIPLQIEDTK